MKSFTKWFIVFAIFFVGTIAVLNLDEQCKVMTGEGGQIVSTARAITNLH